MRPARRSLALSQHSGVAAFAESGKLVADLRPRPGGVGSRRRVGRAGPVGRDADTGEVDEREIDALSGGDGESPRAVGSTAPGVGRHGA